MGLWDAFRGGRPETKGAIDRRYSSSPNFVFQGVPYSPIDGDDVDKVVKEQYNRVIWVYRAIDARASNAAKLPIDVKDGLGDDAQKIHNHPLDRLFNRRANRYEDAYSFRYRFHTLADLSRKGVFVEVLEDRMGTPRELVLLNPSQVFPVPHPDKFVERFEMRLAGGEVFDQLMPYEKGKGGVLWIKRPHPTDPYRSQTWLEAAGISIELDYYARLFNRNFMFNDGRPGGVLALGGKSGADDDDEDVDPADAQALLARLQGGPANAGRIALWEGNVEYTDLSTSPRDAQYVESRGLTQREILVAAGTPLSVIGDASGRTFDNADAEEENFWRHTMPGELRLFATGFEPLTDDGIDGDEEFIVHDLSKVSVLQRDERARKKVLDDDEAAGRISIDEWRKETGRDEIGVPGTKVLWKPSGKAPIGDEEDVNALLGQGQEQAPPGLPPGPGGDQLQIGAAPDGAPTPDLPPDPTTEVDDSEIAALLEGKAFGPDLQTKGRPEPGYLNQIRAAHDALLTEWETQVKDAILAVLDRQQAVVLARMTGAKARRHTRHWTPLPVGHEIKALDPSYILDRARWIGELVTAIRDIVRAAAAAAGAAVFEQLDVEGEFDLTTVVDQIVTRSVQVIAEAMDARWGKLHEIITDAEEAGEPLDRIAERVRDAYTRSDTWAETGSRAVVGAMNAASLLGAGQAGAVRKRWLATDDERTRHTHREAEGQVQPIGQPFIVGGVALICPGDPTGGATTISEWINCRCTMIYQLAKRDFEAELDQDLADLDSLEWKRLAAVS
ncbi:phage portal protein [Phycicoccus sp.]|uniref:phage portal protein n=1 Tax=Phycicoccus sp. TaxID=1902410 RepID=UPI002B7EC645|nr:phage portal protein [Phycicoccus sp.]HMM95386.1 phage portal protein [Phycicoccus sp.]